MTTNAIPNALFGVAYLVNGVGFLRRYRQGKGDLPLSEALGYVATGLAYCLLVHADEILAFYRPSRPVFAAVAVLSVIVAVAVVTGSPRSLRAWWDGVLRDEALDRDLDRDAAERVRCERLKARVVELEDTFRRTTWLRQSRLAMCQLNEMLAAARSNEGGGGSASEVSGGRPK